MTQVSDAARPSGLTGFQLKLIALVCMTIDHIGHYGAALYELPEVLRLIGRIAAPIFVYMVAEGFAHTRSRGRYLLRLYIGAELMRLANMFFNLYLPLPNGAAVENDIFSTMFCIVLLLWWIETVRRARRAGRPAQAAAYVLLIAAFTLSFLPVSWLLSHIQPLGQFVYYLLPSPLYCEGSYMVVLIGIGFYFCRNSRRALSVFYTLFLAALVAVNAAFGGPPVLLYTFFMWLSLPLLLLYNGQRGRGMKYLFYLYYPAHVYILAFTVWLLSR